MQQTREQHIISAVVDAETQFELRRRAAAADRTVSAEVRRALRRYLGDDDQEQLDDKEEA
jgi:plasmid stability protein